MESIKRSIIRSLILTLCLILCLPQSPAAAGNVENSLVIGVQCSKTQTIRPLLPVERDMVSIYQLVYESLIYLDDDYHPQGKLAQSWDVSSNGKTWTFYLRPSVTFSDGTPLTARDVVASAQYILDRANDENTEDSGFYANLKYFISSVSASDDSTVVIKTSKRPCYGFLYAMTFPVVPAALVDADTPPGTGPYLFNTFAAGDYAWLQANPNWWQAQPQVQELMFSFRTNQLECLLMNNSASELTREVRQAIRCVIDTSKIISNVYSGLVTPTNLPFYPGTWMYNDTLSSYFTLSQAEARRLLEEAGWGDSDEDGVLDKLNSEGKPLKQLMKPSPMQQAYE